MRGPGAGGAARAVGSSDANDSETYMKRTDMRCMVMEEPSFWERSHWRIMIRDDGSPEPFNCSPAAWLTAGRGAVHPGHCVGSVTRSSASHGGVGQGWDLFLPKRGLPRRTVLAKCAAMNCFPLFISVSV